MFGVISDVLQFLLRLSATSIAQVLRVNFAIPKSSEASKSEVHEKLTFCDYLLFGVFRKFFTDRNLRSEVKYENKKL